MALGKLIADEGGSVKFTNSNLWVNIHDEVSTWTTSRSITMLG